MPSTTTLLQATQAGDKEQVTRLLLQKCDPDQTDSVYQWTALHLACRDGRLEIIKLLVAHKANVDARDCLGQTPLHRAAHWGQTAIVRYLISVGADFTALDQLFQSPEELARNHGFPETAEVIQKSIRSLERRALSHYTPKQQQEMRKQLELKTREDRRRKTELLSMEKRNRKMEKEREELKKQEFKLREKKTLLQHELELVSGQLEGLSASSPSSPEVQKALERASKLEKKLQKTDQEILSLSKQTMKKALSRERGDAWLSFLTSD